MWYREAEQKDWSVDTSKFDRRITQMMEQDSTHTKSWMTLSALLTSAKKTHLDRVLYTHDKHTYPHRSNSINQKNNIPIGYRYITIAGHLFIVYLRTIETFLMKWPVVDDVSDCNPFFLEN